jgi:hypothetical protein
VPSSQPQPQGGFAPVLDRPRRVGRDLFVNDSANDSRSVKLPVVEGATVCKRGQQRNKCRETVHTQGDQTYSIIHRRHASGQDVTMYRR